MWNTAVIGSILFFCINGVISSNSDCPEGQYLDNGRCTPCFADNISGRQQCRDMCSNAYPVRRCKETCQYYCIDESCPIDTYTNSCVLGCTKGWYGDTCDKKCSKGCISKTCDRDGNCSCQSGYYGRRCNMECPDNCNETLCEVAAGNCNHGCKTNWYGDRCEKTCLGTCNKTVCDFRNDICTNNCKLSLYGDKCDKRCPSNCNNGQCTSGICDGCKPTQRGPFCNESCSKHCETCSQYERSRCLSCRKRKYGPLCEKTCGNCQSETCDMDGNCIDSCPQSKATLTCKQGCTDGWYGGQCDKPCSTKCKNGICQRENGTCIACLNSKSGYNCDMNCSNGCRNSVCDRLTAICTDGCSDSFYGSHCNLTCSSQCKGGLCHQYNGICIDGCEGVLIGPYCNLSCSRQCRKDICDQYTGNCTGGCSGSFYGSYCNISCSLGCSGFICDQMTGACTKGCNSSFYGSHCNHTCSNSCSGNECAQSSSGDLTCVHGCGNGWWGSYCQDKCPGNCKTCEMASGICTQCKRHTYGFNCSETCSERCVGKDCDITGVCSLGCASGFIGENCKFSPLSIILPVCVFTILTTVSVSIWLRKRYGVMGCHKESHTADIEETAVTVDLTGNDNINHRTLSGRTSVDNMPLLRAEPYVRKSSVTTTVLVSNFRMYVYRQKLSGGLIRQFRHLPVNPVYPCYTGDLSRSAVKNRYGNILPYDFNRVVLEEDLLSQSSEYINASLIKGYSRNSSFIATQGPFSEVFKEFWQMIWQKNGRKIVMLTNCTENRRVKCEQYWPNMGQTRIITPNISVECVAEIIKDDFTIRTFIVMKEGEESRVIKQFHFTTWPDHDVPHTPTSLVNLHTAVTTNTPSVVGPVVVHCSAGVGRTGTYIALDYLIEQAEALGAVDVFECVLRLRHQRMNLVQTEEQYVLLHKVLLQAIESLNASSVSVDLHTEGGVSQSTF